MFTYWPRARFISYVLLVRHTHNLIYKFFFISVSSYCRYSGRNFNLSTAVYFHKRSESIGSATNFICQLSTGKYILRNFYWLPLERGKCQRSSRKSLQLYNIYNLVLRLWFFKILYIQVCFFSVYNFKIKHTLLTWKGCFLLFTFFHLFINSWWAV